MLEIVIFALVGILIGFSKGGLGGPVPVALTVPMLTLIIEPQIAVALVLPLLLFADAFALYFYWREWDRRYIKLMLLPGLLGVAAGAVALNAIDAVTLKRVIGGLTLLALGFKIASDQLSAIDYAPRRWHGYSAGWASGFGSTLANVGAPPFTAYLLLQPQMTPRRFIGTTTLFFAVMNLTKLPAFLHIGNFDMERLQSIGWVFVLIPPAVLVARKLIDRIDQRAFEWLMMLPLLALSLYLLLFS
ncbi:MAG: sulfite exporter TauE/SafE family protein [Chloroflexi bacterium]|nr:sulfite exporter TauE/SafE family protein [Chloroflexota bacterium]MCY3583908.1 sulfite exporter TauE/SafE family protein [Chloroflexota bacterium]MCY3715990.1 sulfite exporter TauE/SafE family protein [Chloroflexota bacterium]MDE2650314.1 sulfite exporter TauE/SafE family protein [Chloroflexota bacterium]MXX50553.1 sulfite exporter TauE/SafE family protein [Chloroflexota bacterium]